MTNLNLLSRDKFTVKNLKRVFMDRAIFFVLLILIVVIAFINPKILSFRV